MTTGKVKISIFFFEIRFDNNIAANAYGMHWGKNVSFKF